MGCVGSKQTVLVTPAVDNSGGSASWSRRIGLVELEKKKGSEVRGGELRTDSSRRAGRDSVSFRLGNLHRYVEGEQVAAGWPAWLSAVAGEAIHGWVPLQAESFQKLEKIGQGTYSSVFRARDIETGSIVALKKVRFDNFEPESVRFMAREILILRRLDHPNIIKLEGIVTSRFSCSIYLVFEYMEHDLTGLLSCPDVKFNESQVKCYMKQLLSGVEHCHSQGVIHRDIKGSNLLINNEGILKVADFGLANFCCPANGHPLTSRVVTLWYRPPELLLGSTEYGSSVDLWSIGCVFAEILLGKPILQGRTEVEQLHKIFKLCGSPPDDYWKRSRLPHSTLFKSQHTYESRLLETCRGFPDSAVNLLTTLLSVEPHKRDTASAALASEYFKTKPYACDPSYLPKYPPSKEIDAKNREDAKRKKLRSRNRGLDANRIGKSTNRIKKLAPVEDLPPRPSGTHQVNGDQIHVSKDGVRVPHGDVSMKPLEPFHSKHATEGEVPFSGPLQLSSSGFSWARRRNDESSRFASRGYLNHLEESNGTARCPTRKPWNNLERPDSFDSCEAPHSQKMAWTMYRGDGEMAKRTLIHENEEEKVEFSGPLPMQPHKVDQLLERNERHIRQAVRRSWFRRDKKSEK